MLVILQRVTYHPANTGEETLSEGLAQIRSRSAPQSQKQSQELLHEHAANELVFAVVGHVGSGTTAIAEQLRVVLTDANLLGGPYEVEILKAREQIEAWAQKRGEEIGKDGGKLIETAKQLQNWGDEMRSEHSDHAAVARHLIHEIRLRRAGARKLDMADIGDKPVMPDGKRRAYILDAIRHPAEVHLLRRVYQNAFTLLGVVCDEGVREGRINKKFDDAGQVNAQRFMERDAKAPEKFGQRVSDAFHLADAFLDNSADREVGERDRSQPNEDWDIPEQLSRLVKIITHSTIERPTTAEIAMYEAYGAQMRSACLSRQVGAALVDQHGNLVSTGTNEVPRAGGGVYGKLFDGASDQRSDERCAYRTRTQDRECKNTSEQNRIIDELMDSLIGPDKLLPEERRIELKGVLRGSRIRGLLEFSRAVHAEMDALLTAARKGALTKGTRLFVTTFPCHYCARHVVSAGVDEVQYIEPYPKSRAFALHDDSITKENEKWTPPSEGGEYVRFRPFTGVAPRMYRRAFLKNRPLKNDDTGKIEFGQPEWGSVWDAGRLSYVQLEAELYKEAELSSSEE